MTYQLLHDVLQYPAFKQHLCLLNELKNHFTLKTLYTSPRDIVNFKRKWVYVNDIVPNIEGFEIRKPFQQEILSECDYGDPNASWFPNHLIFETDFEESVIFLSPELDRHEWLSLLLDSKEEAYILYQGLYKDPNILYTYYDINPERDKALLREQTKEMYRELAPHLLKNRKI